MLFDLGHVSSNEPYRRLVNQGYIQAFAYTDARGPMCPPPRSIERDGKFFYDGPDGEIEVNQEFGKIGKSLKNSVSPDEICDALRRGHAAACTRCRWARWRRRGRGPTKDVVGAHRFLQRVWRAVIDETTGAERVSDDEQVSEDTLRALHKTIAGVAEDYAALRNNTAAAKLIEYTNHLTKEGDARAPRVEPLVLMVAPLAPHLAEELWRAAGARGLRWRTDRSRRWTSATWSRTPSSSRSRSTARCAARSPSRPSADKAALEARRTGRREGAGVPGRCHPEEGHRGARRLVNFVVVDASGVAVE